MFVLFTLFVLFVLFVLFTLFGAATHAVVPRILGFVLYCCHPFICISNACGVILVVPFCAV